MTPQEAQALHEKISALRLMTELKERVTQTRLGLQPAHATFYRAFQEGGTTPLLRLILDEAKSLVEEKTAALVAA